MIIGIPKEIKHQEYRVGATPGLVELLVQAGHKVLVQQSAGQKIGYTDTLYEEAGAQIVPKVENVYEAEMVLKVKEPQNSEVPLLKKGQILFCYFHFAVYPDLLKHLIERKVIGIAYETITDPDGSLPLLTPMSEVAGRMAVQVGATGLQMINGGKGLLLGGVPGVAPAKVVVLGGGVVGTQVARMAVGMGADVTIIEKKLHRLRELDDLFGFRLKTIYSTPNSVREEVTPADLIVGAVLIPGKKAPCLITENMVREMSPGTVFVDVAIDQGGCSETSRATTYADPFYTVHNVVHSCVANLPSGCARTSTQALVNATAPYVMELANQGYKQALKDDLGFLEGLNICLGHVTNKEVAEDGGYPYDSPEQFLTNPVEALT